MTDCVLFATLFATYAVLRNNTAGGPSGEELFHLPYILIETLLLLTSSFTAGLAMLALRSKQQNLVIFWLILTFVLGLSFLLMEITEFSQLAHEGNSWQRSGFLSGYFTLVGTHGLHILTGLLWLVVMIPNILRLGINHINTKRLMLFSLFWHFLDIVWIFIFTFVYLMGGIHL
jgi:cytochrome o ubiquinol oxidase subunit 3